MKIKRLILIMIMIGAIMAECMFLICIKNKDRQVINSRKKMVAGIVLELTDEISTIAHISSPDYKASSHIYSHRGIEGDIEHSFEAYDSAINAGSRYIEQDIVISKDGTLYVSHDPSAYPMTGVSKDYADMTDEEIEDLRTYKGKKILKLSDVFDKYGRTVNYVIELKGSDENLLRSFEDIIDKYNYEDIVIAQCEFLPPLSSLKKKYPAMPMLYICRSQKQISEGISEPYVDIVGARINFMSVDNCDAVHNAGKKFCIWTLNTQEEIETAIRIGADSYFTNDTALAIALEKKIRQHLG